MKMNPMLRALDHKIAELIRQRAALDGQLEVLKATRAELAPLVRKRKGPQAGADRSVRPPDSLEPGVAPLGGGAGVAA